MATPKCTIPCQLPPPRVFLIFFSNISSVYGKQLLNEVEQNMRNYQFVLFSHIWHVKQHELV